MFNRPQKHRRTCWSIVTNLLSEASPSKLLLGYLYVSGLALNSFANAQNVVAKTYYLRGNREMQEPSSICASAAPGCILSAKGIFSDGKLNGFKVSQQCDESDEVTYVGRASLANQLKMGLFHGEQLCDATLTNTVLKDPINSRFRHNTDYSVNLEKEDRVELTYRPLLSDPNRL